MISRSVLGDRPGWARSGAQVSPSGPDMFSKSSGKKGLSQRSQSHVLALSVSSSCDKGVRVHEGTFKPSI